MRHRGFHGVGLFAAVLSGGIIAGCPAPQDAGLNPDGSGTDVAGDQAGNSAPTAVLAVTPVGGIGPGTVVVLDGSASSDPDGDQLQFEWKQTAGDAVSLAASGASASFAAPLVVQNVQLGFALTVRDGKGGESTAEVFPVVEVGTEFAGHPQSVLPYRDSLTSDEAYHLIRRAAFGATPAQVQNAVAGGLRAAVEDLLAAKPVPDTLVVLADQYRDDMPRRWLTYMIESPNPLQERMALFWHDRFATSRRVLPGGEGNLAIHHWQMLRAYALTNYRDFLGSLTLDPLMLIWLDGANSPKASPNENYAREFWELFTLGRDVLYTETDIREASRAFTGITLLRRWPEDPRPIFDLRHHDETPKLIFPGRTTGPFNYDYKAVIDVTLAQPEAARYVARNVFVAFVHANPSDAVVEELAEEFRRNHYNIAPLVRKVLLSQAMFSREARFNQIASPVEHAIGVARTFDMHLHSEESQGWRFNQYADDLANAGQQLMNPPGVEGWTEDRGWLQDQWLISRARALGRTMDYGPDRTAELPYHLLPPRSTWTDRNTRGQIVDAVATVLHLDLTAVEREAYVEVLDQGGWRSLHLEDPRYQPQHVFEMIRLMTMHPRVVTR
ncbi:MAG: DUF1800 family protein [Planctomycetia bacterium]|nr:MAG: DUF1800 family protein [Planctomycetia bacterium]